MKILVLLLTMLAASVCYAEESLVYEGYGQFRSDFYVRYSHFEYNKKKGVALVRVRAASDRTCTPFDERGVDCFEVEDYQDFRISGLYFDKSVGKRGAIVYDSGEEKVVCAYHRRFWGPKYTGLCKTEAEAQDLNGNYIVRLFVDL